ncbi:MAG: putative DNA-binding domain-containing protein [Piscinibacter sp.]|nr:putative DNA-binding domain-containing protein [Piscinibacter sp.]
MSEAEARRQRQLLAALSLRGEPPALRERGARAERGLAAYRANASALAERALAAACPTLQAMLGEADFAALARAFWRDHPPQRGDLGEWGASCRAGSPRRPAWPNGPGWPTAPGSTSPCTTTNGLPTCRPSWHRWPCWARPSRPRSSCVSQRACSCACRPTRSPPSMPRTAAARPKPSRRCAPRSRPGRARPCACRARAGVPRCIGCRPTRWPSC